MDVLLDTNAIRAAGLQGPAFKSLRDYLDRTQCRLLVPTVVLEELLAQRRAEVRKLQRDLVASFKELKRLDPASTLAPPKLDEDALVERQREYVLSAASDVELLENQPDDVANLIRRLANRLPPNLAYCHPSVSDGPASVRQQR